MNMHWHPLIEVLHQLEPMTWQISPKSLSIIGAVLALYVVWNFSTPGHEGGPPPNKVWNFFPLLFSPRGHKAKQKWNLLSFMRQSLAAAVFSNLWNAAITSQSSTVSDDSGPKHDFLWRMRKAKVAVKSLHLNHNRNTHGMAKTHQRTQSEWSNVTLKPNSWGKCSRDVIVGGRAGSQVSCFFFLQGVYKKINPLNKCNRGTPVFVQSG